MPVRIVTDSTSYLPTEELERHGIAMVSLGVNFPDGSSFPEVEIGRHDFYERMAASPQVPTSSQPAPSAFMEVFEPAAEAGDDVLGVFLSAKMSGTSEAGRLAADMVRERHPEARIEVLDSRSNCMELGFAVLAAARVANTGGSLDEAADAARATIDRTRFLFLPRTLDYLRKGGRIGGASALLGSLLDVKPILTVVNGETQVFAKVRKHSRAVAEILGRLQSDAEEFGLRVVAVHHIDAEETARSMLVEPIRERLGIESSVVAIGPVIGLHVGPGTVGVVYETERPLGKNTPGG